MISPEQIYNKKLQNLIMIMLLYFSFIALRLIHLQIVKHQHFAHHGKQNFLRFKVIPAQRGNIVDCSGIPLATNQPVTQLIWKGTGNCTINQTHIDAFEKITKILGYEPVPFAKIKRAEKFGTDVILSENISDEQLCHIAEQCSDATSVTFQTRFERFYPYQTVASHILGYLGDMRNIAEGKMGLEKICEETLRGDPGIQVQSINSFGSLLDSKEIKPGSAGDDIVTSIDLQLQLIVEQAMQDQIEGSCIIMDPKTGFIKALVSKPNFKPSIFSQKLTPEQWKELQDQKMFLNRAFNASYPPASIFKLVTIAAALEEKIITPESRFVCPGYSIFKNRKYFCCKRTGHGKISTEDSLTYSCNIPFFEMAKYIHIDTLARYAYEFGLGSKTNIQFSEKSGLIPTNQWKIENKGERWWTGETLSASIGQSFLLVTPIQIACMIGAIFHGYLVKPRVVVDAEFEKKPLSISLKTRLFLQECMKAVISTGTGRRIHKIGNLTIYAKTGTAQTKTRKTADDVPLEEIINREDKEHAWFVSYFHTDTTDPLVLVMLLEHVGKSTHAVGVAKQFFIQYQKLLRIQKTTT